MYESIFVWRNALLLKVNNDVEANPMGCFLNSIRTGECLQIPEADNFRQAEHPVVLLSMAECLQVCLIMTASQRRMALP